MNKLVKPLIIINGLLIPIFLGILGYMLIKSNFQDDYYEEEQGGIIVGEEVEKAKQDSLILQGIEVGTPIHIGNSKNLYLPVNVSTYEEPKYVGDDRLGQANAMISYDSHCINIVFLDKDYKVLGKLLEKNGSITEIRAPDHEYQAYYQDTTIHHISYEIGFEDTDGNGMVNQDDDRDLYVSSLSGTNLTKVTKAWDINYSQFVQFGKKLLISYKIRDEQRDEYKRSMFALYDLRAGTLTTLSDLDATLETIERDLNK